MSEPTLHDVFVALGGDEAVTDPTIAQLLDAAGGAVKKIARPSSGDPSAAVDGQVALGLEDADGIITGLELQPGLGGNDWVVGDHFTVSSNDENADCEVDQIGGGGTLVAFHIVDGGTGYAVGNVSAIPTGPGAGGRAAGLTITSVQTGPPATSSLTLTLTRVDTGAVLGAIPVDQDTTAGDLATAISAIVGFACPPDDPDAVFGIGDYLGVTIEAGHAILPIAIEVSDFTASTLAAPAAEAQGGAEAEVEDHPVLTFALCGDPATLDLALWVKVRPGIPGSWGQVTVTPAGGLS